MESKCHICSSINLRHVKEHHFYYEQDDSFKTFNYYFCTDCGLISIYPRVDEAFLGDFYSTYSDLTDPTEVERAREVINYIENQYSAPGFAEKGRVIEVGSGDGHLLHLFSKNGFKNVYGVEPSGPRRERSIEKYGVKNIFKSLSDIKKGECFDLLLCTHVIEHIADPMSFIRKLASLLNEGGGMYIEVPSYLMDRSQFPDMAFSHLSCFSTYSLSEMLKKSGLSVVRAEHYTGLSVPILRAFALKKDLADSLTFKHDDIMDLYDSVVEREKKYRGFIEAITKRVLQNNQKGIKTVIWPSGTDTREIIYVIEDGIKSPNDILFVDSDVTKHGKKIRRFEIKPPKSVMEFCDSKTEIIIASAYSNTRESIISDIKKSYPSLYNNVVNIS